jgi:hypothetical protein
MAVVVVVVVRILSIVSLVAAAIPVAPRASPYRSRSRYGDGTTVCRGGGRLCL